MARGKVRSLYQLSMRTTCRLPFINNVQWDGKRTLVSFCLGLSRRTVDRVTWLWSRSFRLLKGRRVDWGGRINYISRNERYLTRWSWINLAEPNINLSLILHQQPLTLGSSHSQCHLAPAVFDAINSLAESLLITWIILISYLAERKGTKRPDGTHWNTKWMTLLDCGLWV